MASYLACTLAVLRTYVHTSVSYTDLSIERSTMRYGWYVRGACCGGGGGGACGALCCSIRGRHRSDSCGGAPRPEAPRRRKPSAPPPDEGATGSERWHGFPPGAPPALAGSTLWRRAVAPPAVPWGRWSIMSAACAAYTTEERPPRSVYNSLPSRMRELRPSSKKRANRGARTPWSR